MVGRLAQVLVREPGLVGTMLSTLSESQWLWGFLGEPEVFRRDTKLRAQASDLVLGEALVFRIVGQRRECLGLVPPEVADPGSAPRTPNVESDPPEREAVTTGAPDEFSQSWHLGEQRRQRLSGLGLCYANLRRLDNNATALKTLCRKRRRARCQGDLRLFEPLPETSRRSLKALKGLQTILDGDGDMTDHQSLKLVEAVL